MKPSRRRGRGPNWGGLPIEVMLVAATVLICVLVVSQRLTR